MKICNVEGCEKPVTASRAAKCRYHLNEYARELHKKRMETDPEYAAKKLASSRKWREENPEKQREYVRAWAATVDRSEYTLEWARVNKEKRNDSNHKWRAAQKGAGAEFIDRNVVWDEDQGICGICYEPADPGDWHLDHVIPLSRGGSHTRDNVQVSHPFCNISKKDKLMTEIERRQ